MPATDALARKKNNHDNKGGAAAAVLIGGALLGAAALAAASNDHRDEYHYVPPPKPVPPAPIYTYAPFSPRAGVTCYPAKRACYHSNGTFAVKMTNRYYGY